MDVPIAFECKKCGQRIQSKGHQSNEKIICPECGYENPQPKRFTLPDSAKIRVKGTYFND